MLKSHKTTGITKILELPFFYNLQQLITGAEKAKYNLIQEYVAPFENAKILDIGCGTGIALEYMKVKIEYVGFDINQEYIDFANKKYYGAGRFYCSDVNNFHQIEDNFDIVMAIGILHHLSDSESEKLIYMANNALKKGGYFVMAEPVWTDNQSFLERFLMKQDRGTNIRNEIGYTKLLEKFFSLTESYVRTGIINIPWTVLIKRSQKS